MESYETKHINPLLYVYLCGVVLIFLFWLTFVFDSPKAPDYVTEMEARKAARK